MNNDQKFPQLGLQEFLFNLESDYRILHHQSQGKGHIDKPHSHDFFLFFLVEKGRGTHTIDFKTHEVSNHQLHLLFPDQIHQWTLDSSTLGYQLMISHRIFETFPTSLWFNLILYQQTPILNLPDFVFEKLHYEFKSIKEEMDRVTIDWNIVYTRSKLIALLVNQQIQTALLNNDHHNAYIFQYIKLIEDHFRAQKSVQFYADLLAISANYLTILCKRHLQVSALFLIHNRIILEAKRLILSSDLSIKEISFELGFNDPAYFSNFFKQQTGIPPRVFKEQL